METGTGWVKRISRLKQVHLKALSCQSHRRAVPTVRAFAGFEISAYNGAVVHTMWSVSLPKEGENPTVTGKTDGSETDIRSEREGF